VLVDYSYLGVTQPVIAGYTGQPGRELTYYTSGGSGRRGRSIHGPGPLWPLCGPALAQAQRQQRQGTLLGRIGKTLTDTNNRTPLCSDAMVFETPPGPLVQAEMQVQVVCHGYRVGAAALRTGITSIDRVKFIGLVSCGHFSSSTYCSERNGARVVLNSQAQ